MTIIDFLLSLLVSILGSILGTLVLQLLGRYELPSMWQPARRGLTNYAKTPLR